MFPLLQDFCLLYVTVQVRLSESELAAGLRVQNLMQKSTEEKKHCRKKKSWIRFRPSDHFVAVYPSGGGDGCRRW